MEQLTQESTLQSRIKNKKSWKHYVEEGLYLFLKLLILYLIILLIQLCVGGIAVVHGKSMEATIAEGDRVIYQHLGYELKRGDIVICRTGKGYEDELIKRIVGLPGDTVNIDEDTGKISVNGMELQEPYLNPKDNLKGDISYPVTVPDGQYFVLGDNRSVSLDSRYSEIGMVERSKIDGKVIFRIYPFSKIGLIK